MPKAPRIPLDIYESVEQIVIIMPLAGVDKDLLKVSFIDSSLCIQWQRIKPPLEELVPVQEECFWGHFTQTIELPPHLIFHAIRSKMTRDNILMITLPKVRTPGHVEVEIE